MAVSKELFGTTRDGKEVYCYAIENKNGMCAKVITYGAILKNLYVPNGKGKVDDVVLGYDKLLMYFQNGSCFGATIGMDSKDCNCNACRSSHTSCFLHGKLQP